MVLMINGSPHKEGCTFSALSEIQCTLKKEGFESEIFHIGSRPIQGCTGCYQCRRVGACVFEDELYVKLHEKVQRCEALIIGAPVYYAGIPGGLCSILDRLFFSAGKYLARKPAAGIVNCRRGGASAAFDRLNKYFTINQMPVVTSQYWNSTHGASVDDQKQDLEGLQTLRVLARNLAYTLRALATAKHAGIPLPATEERVWTNFIR